MWRTHDVPGDRAGYEVHHPAAHIALVGIGDDNGSAGFDNPSNFFEGSASGPHSLQAVETSNSVKAGVIVWNLLIKIAKRASQLRYFELIGENVAASRIESTLVQHL